MKKILTLITLILTISFAFGQTEKTLVKTFNLQGATAVVLNLGGNVEVQEWSENTLRVQMNITLENTNVNMLKYLITQGRYNLVLEPTNEDPVITSPGREKNVVINKDGDILTETVTYVVFVPKNVKTEIINKETEEANIQSGDK